MHNSACVLQMEFEKGGSDATNKLMEFFLIYLLVHSCQVSASARSFMIFFVNLRRLNGVVNSKDIENTIQLILSETQLKKEDLSVNLSTICLFTCSKCARMITVHLRSTQTLSN